MTTRHEDPGTVVSRRGSILGTRVVRTEDPELLRGEGRYVADLPFTEKLHAVFARSDVAHGLIRVIHTDEARRCPGVVAVWTAAELDVAPHHSIMPVHPDFARPPLATDRVRFVGEPYAVVFARTAAEGEDAVALIWAEFDELDPIVDAEEAIAAESEATFAIHGNNIAISVSNDPLVDLGAVSDVVVRGRYVNQRMAVASMEPNCCAAAVDDDGRLTIWPSHQMPHVLHRELAAALGQPIEQLRVITPRVGGGFGGKGGLHPEFTVVAKAALVLRRPVVWVPSRSDDMQALPHSRGQIQYAELGCRRDGTFTALRVHLVGDAGAYPTIGAFLPIGTRRMSQGTYDFGAIQFDVAVAVTNTTPMGAYRGAGRPEATALLERLVDHAALELGIDPVALREKNFLGNDRFPFTSLTGNVYDSGDYSLPLRTAAKVVGYDELRAEQRARRSAGDDRLLGIGVSAYVEITAGGGAQEFARVVVDADGSATMFVGTSAHGQGHQTAYAMLVAARTGIPVDRITLVDGDTDRVPQGGGTGGSRSLQLGGSAVDGATGLLVDRARRLAADLLEADLADVVVDVEHGTVGVVGVPANALTWAELARRFAETSPGGAELDGQLIFDQRGATFPFGAHIAVVEIDRQTGKVTLLRHVAVDDCGTVLNPMLVEGQQHGGMAAGIGQALFEEVVFDGHGNPQTANFADYCIASAADLPNLEAHSTETPSPLNPLGAKGIGEAATIGATPAVQNAVVDALAHLGVRHIDLPCTPERVWRTIRQAESGSLPDPWRDPPAVFATLDRGMAARGDAEAAAEAM